VLFVCFEDSDCVLGLDGDNGCLSGLDSIHFIWEIAPSNVFKCRHRTYTEAVRWVVDFIDDELEQRNCLFLKLKSIVYGDKEHKFTVSIITRNPLRKCL
jgi:hypothetical protein